MWPGKESAFITEIVTYPQHKVMNLLFCGGKFEEIEEILTSIETFAKAIGIKRLYGGGRKGWKRKAKHLGYKQEYMIRKEL